MASNSQSEVQTWLNGISVNTAGTMLDHKQEEITEFQLTKKAETKTASK
jgi:hypothetical protein